MDLYSPVLREFLRLVFELWFKRIEEELQLFAEALDQWLHDLFGQPTPDWRESFDQLLAEQEAEGRMVAPQSRQDLLDFLEGWAATVDWSAVEGGPSGDDQPVAVVAAAPESVAERPTNWQSAVGGFTPRDRHRTLDDGGRHFWRRLQDAKQQLDEMERVLEALGRKLDAAKLDQVVEIESEVDAIEKLIWRHNDALESARDTWLRYDLGSRAYDQLAAMTSPAALGLPMFVDEQQAERAKDQWKQIGKRLDQRITTLDRVIFGMKVAEYAGAGASLLIAGGVVLKAFQEGGKWAVVKTLAQVAASGAVAYGTGKAVEHGLRAVGASEETIHGVRLAAELVTWLLLLRRVRALRAELPRRAIPARSTSPARSKPRPNPVPPKTETGLVPAAPEQLGKWGEVRLKQVLGGRGFKPKSPMQTSVGKRYHDRIVGQIAHEAKAGLNVGLTSTTRQQALKDAELIARDKIKGSHWHFFRGAKKELLDFLTAHGIEYTVH
jgi:hypothetical protein